MATNWRKLSQADTLRCLGISAPTLLNWIGDGCPVANEDGKKSYDIGRILSWQVDRVRAQLSEDMDGDSPNLERYRKAKAETAEFDLGVKRGRYMPTDEVRVLVRNAADFARKALMSLGKRLAFDLSTETRADVIEDRIDGEIEGILRNISSRAPEPVSD